MRARDKKDVEKIQHVPREREEGVAARRGKKSTWKKEEEKLGREKEEGKKKGRRGYNARDYSPRARLVYRFISASCKRYSAFDSSPRRLVTACVCFF